jgi:DNA-directed RNA polymerase specialized sigma24 family protein
MPEIRRTALSSMQLRDSVGADLRDPVVVLYERVRKIAMHEIGEQFAEDVAHDVWIKVRENGLEEPIPYVAIKHMMIDAIRKIRSREGALKLGDEDGEVPEKPAVTDQQVEKLHRLLARLNATEGELVHWYFYKHENLHSTAILMGRNEQSLRIVLDSLLEKLRKAWERDEHED